MTDTTPSKTAAARIERFLGDYPRGRLTVAVGYASAGGLAWLSRRSKRRRKIRLLIGNLEPGYFTSGSDSDRQEALAFVRRRGVSVRAWRPSDRGAVAHLKVWVVQGRRSGSLNGSANLSAGGLWKNEEMVTAVVSSELETVVRRVEKLFADSRDATVQLSGYLGGGSRRTRERASPARAAGGRPARRRRKRRKGRWEPPTVGRVAQVMLGLAAIAALAAVVTGQMRPVRVPPMGDWVAQAFDGVDQLVTWLGSLGVVGAAAGSLWSRRRGYRRRARRWAIAAVVIVVAYLALRFV